MKKLLTLLVITLLFACNNQPKEQNSSNEETQEKTQESKVDDSKTGRNNYAVVWKWTTKDKKLVEDNTRTISDESMKLLKDGIIEDIYYNSNSTVDKFEYFPNISFVIIAKSMDKAKSILNELAIVKKGIAEYKLFPVGLKWLDRKSDVIDQKKKTNSYVTVWSSLKEIDENKDADILVKQSDSILKLWNEGIIENVYFDIKGTQNKNDVKDFVFFVNASSQEEAVKICDNLPFAKAKIAYYEIHSVGMFWLSKDK